MAIYCLSSLYHSHNKPFGESVLNCIVISTGYLAFNLIAELFGLKHMKESSMKWTALPLSKSEVSSYGFTGLLGSPLILLAESKFQRPYEWPLSLTSSIAPRNWLL